jgi:hypothetical protein
MKSNNLLMFTVVFILLVSLLAGYFLAIDFGSKLDNLDGKISAIEESNKVLGEICKAPECPPPVQCPPCEPKLVQQKTPKKLLRGDIYKIVFGYKNELNICYAKRKYKRRATRRIIISLAIRNTGEVIEANTVNSDVNNKNVEDCITSLIKRIRFPEFDGDIYRDEIYISFDSRSLI